jgi:hypothetical protein
MSDEVPARKSACPPGKGGSPGRCAAAGFRYDPPLPASSEPSEQLRALDSAKIAPHSPATERSKAPTLAGASEEISSPLVQQGRGAIAMGSYGDGGLLCH